jgi:hypothetical protein
MTNLGTNKNFEDKDFSQTLRKNPGKDEEVKSLTPGGLGKVFLSLGWLLVSSLASAQSGVVCPQDGMPQIRAGMMLYNLNAGPQGRVQVLTAENSGCLPRFPVYAGNQQVEADRQYVGFPFDFASSSSPSVLRPNERVVMLRQEPGRPPYQVRTVERAWIFASQGVQYQLTDSTRLYRREGLGRQLDVVGFRYSEALRRVCQIEGPLDATTDWCTLSPGTRVIDITAPCTEHAGNRGTCGHLRGQQGSYIIATIVRIWDGPEGLNYLLDNGTIRDWLHLRHEHLFSPESSSEGATARAGGRQGGRLPAQSRTVQPQVPRRMGK